MARRWPIVLAVLALLALSSVTAVILAPAVLSPPVTVQISSTAARDGNVTVTVTLTSHRAVHLEATASEVAGRLVPPDVRPVFFVQDPLFPVYFGSQRDVGAQLERIVAQLPIYGDRNPVEALPLWQLSRVMANHSNAIIVDLESGLLPANVLPPNSSALGKWLARGGTLIWAGGPIGFFQSVSNTHGDSVSVGGWRPQSSLLGFPLVDPTANASPGVPREENGSLEGQTISPAGDALQTVYTGVPYGANTTLLNEHHGVDLGWDQEGAHPRTSLAVVAVGVGTLFYLGGGLGPAGGPSVADGGYALAIDVARLIGSGFVPTFPAAPAVAHVDLPPFGTVSVSFPRPANSPTSDVIVQLTVGREPSFLGIWPLSETTVPTLGAPAGLLVSGAARRAVA